MRRIDSLLKIMAALRDPAGGCPWDLEQTPATLAAYTLEEAYEVVDAIASGNPDELRDELGDLLFQVVFYSRIAEERGEFDFDDVVAGICDKLTRRHPHVFGTDAERSAGAAEGSWETIKAAERAAATRGTHASELDGVARALPALNRADKLGGRAARVGFDWPDSRGVRGKVTEELAELDAACRDDDPEAIEEELGDLLFSLANFARHLNIDAEQALAAANRKFGARFRGMEAAAASAGTSLNALSSAELEDLWIAQKGR